MPQIALRFTSVFESASIETTKGLIRQLLVYCQKSESLLPAFYQSFIDMSDFLSQLPTMTGGCELRNTENRPSLSLGQK